MDLKRRIEKLEKELKDMRKENDGVFILVTEITFDEEEKRRMQRYEEELLEKLREYPNAKTIIAAVDPRGWRLQLPELGLEVKSNGEVNRYTEG